jgi:hypothetical protein
MAHAQVKLAVSLLAANYPAMETRFGSKDARIAANDDAADAADNAHRNPLWIIVAGMACFFTVAAAVIALSPA